MEKITAAKVSILTVFGMIGGGIAHIFGGWTNDLNALAIMMVIDFATGLVAAALCKSSKTTSGGLSSTACWKGLVKKIAILVMVVVANQLDKLIGVDYIRTAAIIAFIVNEVLSIVENMALLGVPMPPIILKAIDILKGKADGNGKDESK